MKNLLAFVMLALLAGLCVPAGADEKKEEDSAKPAEGAVASTAETPAAVEQVIARLKDKDSTVREAAAEALQQLGYKPEGAAPGGK